MNSADPRTSKALRLYVGLVLAFLLLPVVLVAPMSFSETTYLKFPPTGFTFRWYGEYFNSDPWIAATLRSLLIAAASAVLAVAAGTLAALALRGNTHADKLMRGSLLGPQVVPVIILALGILLLYSRFHLYGSLLGLIAAHAMLAIPFVVTNVAGALRQTGLALSQAARIMGASPLQAFWHVTVPTLRHSMISSGIFAFFISFDELVVAMFVMGRNETLPMRIWSTVREDLTPVVAAVATILIIGTILTMLISELLVRPKGVTEQAS